MGLATRPVKNLTAKPKNYHRRILAAAHTHTHTHTHIYIYIYSTVQKSSITLNYCKFLLVANWKGNVSYCVFTDKTLVLLESFPCIIIIFCCRGSEWEGKMQEHTQKCPRKSFRSLHINKYFQTEKYFIINMQIVYRNSPDIFLNREKFYIKNLWKNFS